MTASVSPTTAEELRGAGLRVTAARLALLEIVRDGDHLGVEAIAAGVRDRIGHISLQAVYDALHALTAAGLVRRIEPAGTPPRFEGRVRDNHHHLVCRLLLEKKKANRQGSQSLPTPAEASAARAGHAAISEPGPARDRAT